jgi:phosphatidate cytidylyltransferase
MDSGARRRKNLKSTGETTAEEAHVFLSEQSIDFASDDEQPASPAPVIARKRLVSQDESRLSKILLRITFAIVMLGIFGGTVYMGHLCISLLVAIIELLLFRELVRVRYSAHYDRVKDKIPLFRTTQWCWFVTAMFYTHSDFLSDLSQSNQELHYLLWYLKYLPTISFVLYSVTFVLTITTLQTGHIKFQMNQLCWTILVILLTVGQLKYIFHNIFNGLIWFVLPCCLVFTNDIMAYVSGMAYGRKFIQRPFIRFSPNKTWEGFIGGWIFTMITAWYLSRYLSKFSWMTCSTNTFFRNEVLTCEPDAIFVEAQTYFPSQIFEVFPRSIVRMVPRVVEICSVKTDSLLKGAPVLDESILTPCVSGEPRQSFHHFELTLKFIPIQLHALWLALFASLVAPFGGFLASAMKRAYGIKDFDSIIPGHGGVMDRMDCQFLLALYTWVHYNTFVKLATVSVPRLTYLYSMLTEQEKKEFLRGIAIETVRGKLRFFVDE